MAVGMLAATSCSDFDDYNSEHIDVIPEGNQTLWKNISDNADLSNFAKLVEKAGYKDALNSSRYFTVWAPLNSAFKTGEVEQFLELDSAKLLKEFVKNHIADRNYPSSGNVVEKVNTLNKKSYFFDGITFGDVALATPNLPSNNGVIHTMQGRIPFLYNVYENLDNITGCDKLVQYFRKYDLTYLDENASIKGPIIEGIQTWIDSVIVKRNEMFLKDLNVKAESEDSSYTMLLPTDNAWDKAVEKIKPCYNYLASFKWQDLSHADIGNKTASDSKMTAALGGVDMKIDASYYTDSLVNRNIVDYIVYNNNESYNSFLKPEVGTTIGDTLLTTRGRKLTNVANVLTAGVGERQKLSNGWAQKVDSLVFFPWETYNPTIKTRNVGRQVAVKEITNWTMEASSLEYANVTLEDSEEEFTWIEATPATLSGKPELDFYLNNLRSATYNIYVVLVADLQKSEEARLPYSLRFDLSYTNESGALQKKTWGDTKNPVMTDPTKVADTISLGEFTFPICYYGINAAPNLKISHTVTSFTQSNRNKYEQILRVANIILRPVEQDKYIATKED